MDLINMMKKSSTIIPYLKEKDSHCFCDWCLRRIYTSISQLHSNERKIMLIPNLCLIIHLLMAFGGKKHNHTTVLTRRECERNRESEKSLSDHSYSLSSPVVKSTSTLV
jgi:hypothetical protein